MQPGESLISPSQVVASEGYFEAMGATLVAGRFFNGDDAEDKPKVLVIDNRLARRFWPNGDALGKRMYFPADINNLMAKPKEDQLMTIVGIIEPIRLRGWWMERRRRPAPTIPRSARSIRARSAWRFAPRKRRRRSPTQYDARSRPSIRRCHSTACAPWRIGCRRH
jgi:hypothetical protein